MKIIRDAIHGDIRASRDWLSLMDTRTFQRLRGIKQLGMSHLVYPSAVHTRFEHSLGTAWLVERLANELRGTGHVLKLEEIGIATLAALLHDVSHIPFGHTIEDERHVLPRHDEDKPRLEWLLDESPLGDALDELTVGEDVRDVLLGRSQLPPYVGQLINGAISADLLDYLRRDAYYCGLPLSYDDRLFKYLTIVDGQLVVRLHKSGAVRHDVVSELIQLLQFRYTLTERVYFHHAKIVAGGMISRAVELALLSGELSARDLYGLRDDGLMLRLEDIAPQVSGLSDLVGDLLSRRLYRPVYLLRGATLGRSGLSILDREKLARSWHSDPAHRQAGEVRLAEALGVPASHVVIYCPSPKMQLREADVPVEIESGEVRPLLSIDHPDVAALAVKHAGLWRFTVLLRRTDDMMGEEASRWCEEEFGFENQLA